LSGWLIWKITEIQEITKVLQVDLLESLRFAKKSLYGKWHESQTGKITLKYLKQELIDLLEK
jgi:hypothetical protein